MNYLVSQIVNFITEQDVISDESDVQDFYRYGIEISISSLLNIVLVVIAGILIHHIIESIVFFHYLYLSDHSPEAIMPTHTLGAIY